MGSGPVREAMRLADVAFRYRRNSPWVLREVSLDLPRGRLMEVTGSNGAGKSTLLRLLAGLSRPRRGTVTGRPARVGYAPERFPADQPFTARRYLRRTAELRGLAEPPIEAWAERLEFASLLDVPLTELSKGSAHKVGLAQALIADPGLLILDEPFAGLDPATRNALPALLAGLAAAGTTVVVSDHQRCLKDVPGVDRLRVADRTVTATAAGPAAHTVIEVTLPEHEAPALLARLRAEGHHARERRP